MKETNKRIAAAAGLGLCVAAAGIAIGIFYQSVIGVQIARGRLGDYAAERRDAEIGKVSWNGDSGRYETELSTGEILGYDMKANTISDPALTESAQASVGEDYAAAIERMPEYEFPAEVTLQREVDAADYDTVYDRLWIGTVWNAGAPTLSESRQLPAQIAYDVMSYMGEEYTFSAVEMTYADRNGLFEVVVEADSSRPMSMAALREGTHQLTEEELADHQDYLQWIEELG